MLVGLRRLICSNQIWRGRSGTQIHIAVLAAEDHWQTAEKGLNLFILCMPKVECVERETY